ncbi:MAG: hypothetical protein IKF39_01865 [Oscillospiraceae bacterium]|nr:hypothetical protein [Oscillospiraceae bacterium]
MIYRDSTRLTVRAIAATSACNIGETADVRKTDRGWLLTTKDGDVWRVPDGTLRIAFCVLWQNGTSPENRDNARNGGRLLRKLMAKGWPEGQAYAIVRQVFRDYNPQGRSVDAMIDRIIPYAEELEGRAR